MTPLDALSLLDGLPQRPWTPVRTQDERGWAISVIDNGGRNIGDREVFVDDAALMAAVHAIAPEALVYVLKAAEKGGDEAKRIAGRFSREYLALFAGPTPVRARRAA